MAPGAAVGAPVGPVVGPDEGPAVGVAAVPPHAPSTTVATIAMATNVLLILTWSDLLSGVRRHSPGWRAAGKRALCAL